MRLDAVLCATWTIEDHNQTDVVLSDWHCKGTAHLYRSANPK